MAQAADGPRGTELRQLLARWRAGDRSASETLNDLVYGELKILAAGAMRRERAGHTLETTGLVHEAYLRLAADDQVDPEGKTHFFGIAARVMRQVLIQHARRRGAAKRGGAALRVTLDERRADPKRFDVDVIDLNQALRELAELDPRQERIVELRYFGGLGVREVADALHLSTATVKREWATAKAWIYRRLRHDGITRPPVAPGQDPAG